MHPTHVLERMPPLPVSLTLMHMRYQQPPCRQRCGGALLSVQAASAAAVQDAITPHLTDVTGQVNNGDTIHWQAC